MWAKDVKACGASPVKGGTFVPEAGKGCKPRNRTSSVFEDDTSHCQGCNSLYIKRECIKTIVNCPYSSILPTAPGIIDLIFVSHDRHLEGKSSLFQRVLFLSSLHPMLIPKCPSICPFLSPCVGLKKECKTSGGFRKANGKWLLNKLKTTAQNINTKCFGTIIWLKWRTVKLRVIKQLKFIYNVGWADCIRRGKAGGHSIL